MTRIPTGIQSTGNTSYIIPPTVLKAEGLVKIYGKRRVVDGVSFHVNKGEVVGLLGPNGAGKTTSFRMTCGLIDANEGIVYLNGKDVSGWPLYRRAREGGMGYLPQMASVFQQLSVQDNLLGMMEMLGMDGRTRREKCDSLLEKMKLTHLRKNMARGLSGGERRRLEIARALVSDPKIILLDEPFAAIDPITVQNLQIIIRQLIKDGISILITDHGVTETLEITDRSYVIGAGKVLCSGTPQEVLANEAAKDAYFGNLANTAQPKTAASNANAGGKAKTSHRFDDIDDDFSHVPKRPSRPARPEMSNPVSRRADDFEDDLDDDFDAGLEDSFENYTPSRRRPTVKVRSPNADVSGSDKRPDRPREPHFGMSDKTNAGKSGGERSPEVRPPKYSSSQGGNGNPPAGGVRLRHDADDSRNGKPGGRQGNRPSDGDKPAPRASLLGRLSGVFKKPTDDGK